MFAFSSSSRRNFRGSVHCFLLNATPGDCKEIGWLKPHFVTENGELRLSIHAVLVETPSCRIIVDMWFATTNSAKMTPRACFAARFCVIWKRPRMGGNSPALMLGASGVVIGTRFHATMRRRRAGGKRTHPRCDRRRHATQHRVRVDSNESLLEVCPSLTLAN
jgi:hypothetical protein